MGTMRYLPHRLLLLELQRLLARRTLGVNSTKSKYLGFLCRSCKSQEMVFQGPGR
jgi:hypothetical protein